jgi:hypothetical protein
VFVASATDDAELRTGQVADQLPEYQVRESDPDETVQPGPSKILARNAASEREHAPAFQ